MGGPRPWFLALALMLAIASLSVHPGFARNIKIMRRDGRVFAEEGKVVVKARETAEMGFSAMDYSEPGANTNPRAGALWGNPPPGPQH